MKARSLRRTQAAVNGVPDVTNGAAVTNCQREMPTFVASAFAVTRVNLSAAPVTVSGV